MVVEKKSYIKPDVICNHVTLDYLMLEASVDMTITPGQAQNSAQSGTTPDPSQIADDDDVGAKPALPFNGLHYNVWDE